jgi:hypothetical protein
MAELSRKQGEAIAALLTTPTISEAASRAGVGERTLFHWLQEDVAFQHVYRQATSVAVKTLEQVMQNTKAPSSSRVSAARAVLEMAFKGAELEHLTVRIEALEQAVHRRNGHVVG